jgi:hypothetical protein
VFMRLLVTCFPADVGFPFTAHPIVPGTDRI